MKKTYKIVYTETLVHHFYVDAENEEEAQMLFQRGIADGEFDFSDGDVVDSDFGIYIDEPVEPVF